MKLLVDFDDTLFNAAKFKESLFIILKNRGVEGVEVVYDKERVSGVPFSLKKFLSLVLGDISPDVDVIYEEIMNLCHHFVNEDLLSIVKEVSKKNCIIVTHGDKEFQEDKIRSAGLTHYFSLIVVVKGTKREVVEEFCKKYSQESVIFIDDKIKFFNDIDMALCPNLKTVVFNEDGIKNLRKEIAISVDRETRTKVKSI